MSPNRKNKRKKKEVGPPATTTTRSVPSELEKETNKLQQGIQNIIVSKVDSNDEDSFYDPDSPSDTITGADAVELGNQLQKLALQDHPSYKPQSAITTGVGEKDDEDGEFQDFVSSTLPPPKPALPDYLQGKTLQEIIQILDEAVQSRLPSSITIDAARQRYRQVWAQYRRRMEELTFVHPRELVVEPFDDTPVKERLHELQTAQSTKQPG